MKKPYKLIGLFFLFLLPTFAWSADQQGSKNAFERADWMFFLYEGLQFQPTRSFHLGLRSPLSPFLADDPCQATNPKILRCAAPRQSTDLSIQQNNYDLSTYEACVSNNFEYDGRDNLYKLTAPLGANWIEIELFGPKIQGSKPDRFASLSANLDIFVYSCTEQSCIASSTNLGTANEKLRINNPSGDYYVIVDGYNSNQISSYVIWAFCDVSDDPCFDTSTTITCNSPINGNTVGTGNDFNNEVYRDCFYSTWPYDGNDIMYRFQTPQGATELEFFLRNLSFDLDMFIYGNCPNGECVAQNVKLGLNQENILINNPSGTYYIIIDGEEEDHIGTFQLEVVCDGGNVSDDPCNSVFDPIECGQTYSEDNIGSESFFFADLYEDCNISNGFEYDGDDRLYRITAPTEALSITIKMTDLNANLDMFLFDCISAPVCIEKSTVSGTGDETITINDPVPGMDYFLIVDGVNANAVSTYTLSVDCELLISEDPCTSPAMDLFCNDTSGLFNNNSGGSNFYADLYEDCLNTSDTYAGNDRLFRFQTPQDVTAVTFNLSSLNSDLDLFVYDCSGFGSCIAKSTSSGSASESITIDNPQGTYYVIVDARTPFITSSFRITADCELENDPCATSANLIDCNQTINSNNFSSNDNFDTSVYASCSGATQAYDARDRVFELTVPADVNFVEISLSGLAANLDLFVFDCTSATTCVAASTNTGTADELIELDVSPGKYRIVVDGVSANEESDFSLTVNCCNDVLIENCDDLSYSFPGTGLNYNFSVELVDWEQYTDGWIWVIDGEDVSDLVTTGLSYEFPSPGTYEVCYDYIDNTTGCQVGCCNTYCIEDPFACGQINIQKDSFPGEGFQFTLLETSVSQITWTMRNESGDVTEIGTDVVSELVLFDPTCPVVDICVRYYDELSGCWKICCITVELCEAVAGCDDCLDCFFYDTRTVNEYTVSFYDNFCEAEDEFGNPLNLTYDWIFIETASGQAANVTYLDGTSSTDPNPIVDFPGPGQYEACIQIFSEEGSVPIQIYACCQTIDLTATPCFDPPSAHYTFTQDQQTGWYYLDASSSVGATSYTWDIPAEVETVYVPGGQAVWVFFPDNACVNVCLLVNNACGQASFCQEFCSVDGCTEIPEQAPLIQPIANGLQVTFDGVPTGDNWQDFNWQIPAGTSFADGTDATSRNPVIDVTIPGQYRICVTYYNICTIVCHCWTVVVQDICAGVEILTPGIQTLGTNVGQSSQFVASDYSCYQGQSTFSAPDQIYEITKSSNEGDLTITLMNDDLNGAPLDLDIFLLDSCLLPAVCLEQSINPFGQPYFNRNFDAIHLPDFPAGTYYVVVDGYNQQQQGSYRITATEGDLFCEGTVIDCGQPITGTTDGAPNNVSAYSCQPVDRQGGYTGPEVVYIYQATFDGIVNISLSGLAPQVDLDLLVLDACDQAANCLGYGKNPAGESELVNLNVTAGQTYYLVLDGWDGSVGNYVLEIEHPTCAPVNTCDNLCADNCCDPNCNHLVYTIEDNYDVYSGYGSLSYRFDNISGLEVCKWEVDGVEVPGTEGQDFLFYTLGEGLHTICMYLKVPGQDCVIQCCKTIYVQPPTDCGESSIEYELVANHGYRFKLNNGNNYQTISWTWENTDSPLGTGPTSNIIDFPTSCESATVSVSYFDPEFNAWFVCSRTVWLCPPEDCGAGNIEYKFNGNTYVFNFDLPNTADLSTVSWSELETGLEFSQGEEEAAYPDALPCEIRTICIRYFDFYTYSWYSCCRRIYLCDPFDCVIISSSYNETESGYEFSIPQEERYTNISWRIDAPTMAPLGTGYTSDLLPASSSCPTYIVTVQYFEEFCNCWRQCSLVFEACPPEDCGSGDPLSLPWLQALIDCDNSPCGLQVFSCRYQGRPVITLRDNPALCVPIKGRVYDCTGELLFTYGGVEMVNNDLAAQLTNCELLYECPLPSPEICDDGLDNDQDGLFDCEDPDCSFDIYFEWTDADCSANNGSATVYIDPGYVVARGVLLASYEWSNGAVTQSINGVAPGTYDVTVTNDDGCQAMGSVTIGEKNNLIVEIGTNKDTICEGDSTLLRSQINGGKPPFVYAWSHGLGSATTALAKPVETTIFYLTVTDINGCQAIDSTQVTVIPAPPINNIDTICAPDLLSYTVQFSTTPGNLVSADHGQVQDLGAGAFAVSGIPTGQDVTLTVVSPSTDCVKEELVPSPICPCPEIPPPSSGGDQEICAGDVIPPLTVPAFDNYNANWYDAAIDGEFLASTFSFVPPQAGTYYVEYEDIFSGCVSSERTAITLTIHPLPTVVITGDSILCAAETTTLTASGAQTYSWSTGATTASINVAEEGLYIVEGTDVNGCKDLDSVFVEIAEPIVAILRPSHVSCFGADDGAISTSVSGGTPPYNFNWNTGEQTADLSGLGPDRYYLTITDARQCILVDSVDITEPDTLVLEANVMDPICSTVPNGSIEILPSGGTLPYRYSWSDDPNATTSTRTDLPAGDYTVTVLDQNDCLATASFTLNNIQTLDLQLVPVDVGCNGESTGSLIPIVSGGTGPYTFLWSDQSTDSILQNIAAGTPYSVEVTDVFGCTIAGEGTVAEPSALGLEISSNDVLCFGESSGSITVVVTGGTPPYNYNWSNGSQGTASIIDLATGEYTVTVTDDNDCELISEPITVNQPDSLQLSGEVTDATSCSTAPDGAIVLTVSGGTPDYTYAWSTGATTKDISGLSGGTYTVTVTDANGCEQIESFTVNEPSSLSVEVTQVDVLCNGEATGSLSLAISGGLAPYTVLWSDGETTLDRQGLAAGTYGYTVTDANQCTFTGAPEIVEPPALTIDPLIVHVTCFGDQNGSIDPQLSGGTPPYSYEWSNGATTPTLNDLGPGTYSLVITDANDCVLQTEAFEIVEPELLVVEGTVTDATSCATAPDGAIVLTVSGGTPDYTYLWSTGATTKDIAGLSGGTYTMTVTDANGCEQIESFTVNEPSSLSVEVTQVDVLCNGEATGSLSLAISGGLAPYTVLWSDGETALDRQGLAAGTYGYTVTDANQCTFTGAPEIVEPPALAIDPLIVHVTCFGDQNGSIDPQLSGGTPPYSYEWSNGATTPTLNDLGPGTYSLVITDANDCVLQTEAFEITEPELLVVEGTVTDATSCSTAPDGAIVLTVSGGTPDYSYAWSTGATTKDIAGLSGGTYTVTVTDANGCEQIESFTVNEPSSLSVEVTQVDVLCNGEATGSLSLAISGGLAPYTVLWSDGETALDRQGLAAGTYGYTVTDANQCTFTGAPEIVEPPALTIDPLIVQVTCFGDQNGSINPQLSGGTPPYNYEWSNGATTPTLNDLGPGTYSLVITDANDCVLQPEAFEITEPGLLTVEGTVTDATSCATAPDGAIVLTVSGGTPDYTYLWSTGATTKDIAGLSGGTYTVTVTDANGCEQIESFTVNEPSSLTVEVTQVDVLCNGEATGSLSLAISGGLVPYTVLWSDGETALERQGLAAGTYGYTVTDANQCTFTGAPEIVEPPALAIDPLIVQVTCFGDQNGSIDPQLGGGTPPYSYEWSNGATTPTLNDLGPGTYSLVITDANDCVLQTEAFEIVEPVLLVVEGTVTDATSCSTAPDGTIVLTVSGGTPDYSYAWSTGATTKDIAGLSGGTYTVTVTDANGCEQIESFTVNEPSNITANLSLNPVSCFGGSDGAISLEISGGNPPYNMQWSDGETSPSRSNLTAGIYEVTITDANDCTFLTQGEIDSPDSLVITPVITDISCAGEADGAIDLTLAGGTPPYSFVWSNGATSQDIADLGAGEYSVVVTDANDCIYQSNVFNISMPAALEISSVVVDATACGNGSDGSISLTVTGGTEEYSYSWNTGAETPTLSNVGPGIYTVTVTDANGCTATHERTVNQPQALEVVVNSTHTTCVGAADGAISLEITRGIPPYDILWEDQSTNTTRTGLVAGTYAYTVTDASNCEETGAVTIEDPPPLAIEATIQEISCAGISDGAIIIQASGGTGGHRFEWSNGSDTPVNNALSSGSYTLLLRDANGCVLDTTFVLEEPPALIVEDVQLVDAACSGQANGSIDISVAGGEPPYAFVWSNGATTEDLNGVVAGNYGLTITDARDCSLEDQFEIVNTTSLSTSTETEPAFCDEANGTITLTISGGTEPYTFDWSIDGLGDNDDEQSPTNVPPGVYEVTVRDAQSCSVTIENVEVGNKPSPVLSLVASEPSICGEATGSATVEVQGGVAPFSFAWSNGSTSQNLDGVPEGTYTLTITDADQCEDQLEVVISCFNPCSLAVGTMGQQKLMGCQSQVLTATYDPTNEVIGDGEVLLFVIHNASGDMLGTSILNVSTDPTIAYTSAMTPNVEYYLSAVVGKDDGNGLIDFNNSCLAVAPGTPFSFAPAPTGPAQLIATNSTLCPGQQLELKVEVQIAGDPTYVWDTPKGIINTNIPQLIVNNFGSADVGEYLVAYNIGGCDSEQLGPLIITLDGEAGKVTAGEGQTLCGDGSFNLEGVLPEGATGTWLTTSPAFIEDKNDPNSFVDSLINGINTFYWLVNTGSCLIQDSVEIYHAVAPTTQDRSITMEANQATLLLNKKALFDQITQTIPDSNLSFSIVQEPDEGQLTVDDEASQLIYQRDLDIEGDLELVFIYEVCNVDPLCGELCSQSSINLTIKYLETEIISYKKGLRPSGKSPTWNITLLRDLTKAEITIVDRWGKRIHFEEYFPEDNLSKGRMLEAWDGKNLAGVSMYTGAYYFIFEGTPTTGDKPIVVKGIVYLLK